MSFSPNRHHRELRSFTPQLAKLEQLDALAVGDCGAYILLLSTELNRQSGHSSNFSPQRTMSTNATHEFPSPVVGVPLPFDFDPAILFSIIHALLIPIALWRIVHSRSRTFVLIGTVLYIVER